MRLQAQGRNGRRCDRPWPATLVALVATSAMVFPAQPASASEPLLIEQASALGVDFVHHSGATGRRLLPEIMGSGVALFDYDRDGDLDLYLVDAGELVAADDAKRLAKPAERSHGDRLFRNELVSKDGAGVAGTLRFTDVTAEVGLDARGYGLGIAVGDVNGDGWQDIYLANLGPNQLWINKAGSFELVEAGVEHDGWSSSATFFDADSDGDLDLYVANYAEWSPATVVTCFAPNSRRDYCGPQSYPPARDGFYLNDGTGRFTASTVPAIVTSTGSGLGVVALDATGDGLQELLVANDGMMNRLWVRAGDGWRDDGLLSGLAVNGTGHPEASMGIAVGDVDGDGDEDVLMTHLAAETDTLLLNQGDMFVDRTARSGLSSPTLAQTSFGTALVDLDADGLKDLVIVSGGVRLGVESGGAGAAGLGQRNSVLRNTGAGPNKTPVFEPWPAGAIPAFAEKATSRGLAVGDLDNDGDRDLVVTDVDAAAKVLINQTNPAQWVGFALTGSAPAGQHGAPLLGWEVARSAGDKRPVEMVRTDGSYLSSGDARIVLYSPLVGEELDIVGLPQEGRPAERHKLRVTEQHLGRYTSWSSPK